MAIDFASFQVRRQTLLAELPPFSAVLVASGEETLRNRDVDYPFRAHSDFVYLTGFGEPDSLAVLINQRQSFSPPEDVLPLQSLFLRPKDQEQEIWQGRRLGVESAPQCLGFDQAWPIEELNAQLADLLDGVQTIYISFSQLGFWMPHLEKVIASQKAKSRQGIESVAHIADLDIPLHLQRRQKRADEQVAMRQAAQITVQGHLAAMRAAKNAQYEYQIQATLEAEFKRLGSPRVAFNSIVAQGENACILHYTENNAPLESGQLVLIDAGAEYHYYAGDVTHTFPLNGRFSPAQAKIYNLVLQAQQAAIAVIKPGIAYNQMHQAAERVITEGLVQLGLLQGEVKELIESQAYKAFFMHGTGHWLGMDVHDVGAYKQQGEWCQFEAGMVVTVEPGLYIAPDSEGVPDAYRGMGVRIEDDVLVTEEGHEVLTLGLPRTIDEIEAFMQEET